MTVRIRTVDYEDAGVALSGEFAWDDAWTGPRPCVVIVHDAMKSLEHFEDGRAAALAGLGYAGFVLDVYGKGVHGRTFDESVALMTPFQSDRAALERRLRAGLATAAAQPEVDGSALAAIGYCFGGMCVLDLARANAPLRGVASFHGILTPPPTGALAAAKDAIVPKVLVLHGWDDPFVPAETVTAFAREMSERGADWQLVAYGGTVHGFTKPSANQPEIGAVYDAKADHRSWQALADFLDELFGERYASIGATTPPASALPPRKLYFEDYTVGLEMTGGAYPVSEAEILEFGRRFDKQPIHNDKDAAAKSHFGGLVAPGCLTFAIRTALGNQMPDRPALVAGLGVEKMDLAKPVRPGDVLSLRMLVIDRRVSAKRPDRGIITMEHAVLNQKGEAVLSMISRMMVEVRDPRTADA
ncbi:MAG: dienelactone hydrolase family protein [Myxococcota bacterium]